MNVPPEFRNFLMYLLQVALLVSLGGLLRLAFRIRLPRVLLIYWQVLLILSLTIPLVTSRRVHTLRASGALEISQSDNQVVPMPPPTGQGTARTDWAGLSWRILLPLLVVICAAKVGRLALGMIRLSHLRSRGRRLELPASGFETIMPLRGKSEFFVSSDIRGPATYGFIRSTILLPQDFEDLDAGSKLSILCHELIHVRRRDWLFGLSEQLIAAFFWFHPAVSWLVQRIELSREQLVDREVLDLSVDRRHYLRSLLFAAGGLEVLLSANLFLSRHHLKERIAALWEDVHMTRRRMVSSLASAVMLFAVGAVICSQAFPLMQTVVLKPEPVAAKAAVAPPVQAAAKTSRTTALPTQAKVVTATSKPVVAWPIPAKSANAQVASPLGKVKVVPIAPPPIAEANNKPVIQKSLAGLVVDADGVFLPGVHVRITDPETNDVLAAGTTSDRGTFGFLLSTEKESVDCTFSGEGFRPSVIRGVKMIGNAPVAVRVTMQIVSATCTLYVKPGAETTAFVSPTPVSGRVMPAMLYWGSDLAYPPEALQQGLEAVVLAEVKVEADGAISDVRIIKGHPHFDAAVIDAVRQWRCGPAYLNGKPHQSVNSVTVQFRLK